ncbi:MAG: lipid II flippase MurJ [Bacillota bacterium]
MGFNILRPESTNRAIALSLILSLIAKVLTFVQSLIISYAFGTQESTDILFYAVSFILLITSFPLFLNQQIVVPVSIDIRNNISEDESKRFIFYVYLIYFFIGVIFTFILLLEPVKTISIFSKFEIESIHRNLNVIRYILLSFIFIVINSFMLDIFVAYKYFSFPMLMDMAKNILVIVCVLVLKDKFNVLSLAIGILIGNAAQFIILNVFMFAKIKLKVSFKPYRISSLVKRNLIYVFSGQVTSFLNGFVVMYLLSGFSAGIYTAVDYGQKISNLFAAVVIGQITTVVGVNFIELFTKKDYGNLNNMFIGYLKKSLFFIIPACFIMSLNSEIIISVVFGRGRFGHDSVVLVSKFFRYFIMSVPMLLINGFLVKMIVAAQIQKVAFLWQSLYNILFSGILYLLISYYGYSGYPIGNLIAYSVYTISLLYYLLKVHFVYIDLPKIIKTISYNLVINLCIFFTLNFILQFIIVKDYKNFLNIIVGACSTLVYVGILLVISYRIEDNRDIFTSINYYLKKGFAFINKLNKFTGKELY